MARTRSHVPSLRARVGRLCLFAATIVLLASPAHAQSARASFFLQMLRQNADARVRVSAALRLSELHEADTVDPMIAIFSNEHDPTVQAAILSALGALGDARALATVQSALRNPNPGVAAQARHALPLLQGAGPSAPGPGTRTNEATEHPSAGGARFLVGVGRVNNQSGVRGTQLSQLAEQALQVALQSNPTVSLHQGSASEGQTAIRTRHLTGHFFDANIQSLQPRGNGVRAAVSIAVSTYPGRIYEFESQTAITITGGGGDPTSTENDAVRRAIESAVNRAIQQLMQGVP